VEGAQTVLDHKALAFLLKFLGNGKRHLNRGERLTSFTCLEPLRGKPPRFTRGGPKETSLSVACSHHFLRAYPVPTCPETFRKGAKTRRQRQETKVPSSSGTQSLSHGYMSPRPPKLVELLVFRCVVTCTVPTASARMTFFKSRQLRLTPRESESYRTYA
jgi:hypothetical protein